MRPSAAGSDPDGPAPDLRDIGMRGHAAIGEAAGSIEQESRRREHADAGAHGAEPVDGLLALNGAGDSSDAETVGRRSLAERCRPTADAGALKISFESDNGATELRICSNCAPPRNPLATVFVRPVALIAEAPV